MATNDNFIPCSLPLVDSDNDTVISINTQSINLKGSDLVSQNPGQYFYQCNTLGIKRLCTIRVDGHPMSVAYTHNSSQATADVTDFVSSCTIQFTNHPVHAPK